MRIYRWPVVGRIHPSDSNGAVTQYLGPPAGEGYALASLHDARIPTIDGHERAVWEG